LQSLRSLAIETSVAVADNGSNHQRSKFGTPAKYGHRRYTAFVTIGAGVQDRNFQPSYSFTVFQPLGARQLIRLLETPHRDSDLLRGVARRGIVPRGTPHELRLISASNVQYSNYPWRAQPPNENVCK